MLMALLALPMAGRGADVNVNATREARRIFAVIRDDPELLNDRRHLLRCEYPIRWQQYGVPDYILRAGLGTKAHREVTAPLSIPGIKDLLGAGPDDAGAFCTEAESKAFDDAELAAFRASDEESKQIDHSGFSFPAFNTRHNKAVVVGMHSSQLLHRAADGVKLMPFQVGYFAIVFGKTNGVWHRLRTEIIGES
jgi:hypothetical protein